MSNSPIAIARALHAALEAGKHGQELYSLFTEDAVTVERPNLIKPGGATTELQDMVKASTAGANLLAKQSYDVHSALEQGSLAVLRLTWTGEIAQDVGSFRKGQKLTAHIAQFIETRGDRIARIETFDCYEPFGSAPEARAPVEAQSPALDAASNLSKTNSAILDCVADHVASADGVRIAYQRTGSAPTALVFVHGWLGCSRWWDAQRDAFSSGFTVVQLDLAGHGASGRERTAYSAEAYARDIVAVVSTLAAKRVVLVGHSMSGAYSLLAARSLPRIAALLLVDTLKNVEQVLPTRQVEEMLALYRRDFTTAVERVLPQWLFGPGTPPDVSTRLKREFLERTGEEGAALLEPLYRFDVRALAAQLNVPVRAINSDLQPTDVGANRRHFRDYGVRLIPRVGHYPMLEAPTAFNAALQETLAELELYASHA